MRWILFLLLAISVVVAHAEDLPSNTNLIKTLTVVQAEALVKRRVPTLSLNSLKSLSPDTAAVLAKFPGRLYLVGLTAPSDAVVQELAKHEGSHLVLNGITSLTDKAVIAISKYKGRQLVMNGLTTLSDEGAQALSERKGELMLTGLTTLSEKAAESLRANPNIVLPDKFR